TSTESPAWVASWMVWVGYTPVESVCPVGAFTPAVSTWMLLAWKPNPLPLACEARVTMPLSGLMITGAPGSRGDGDRPSTVNTVYGAARSADASGAPAPPSAAAAVPTPAATYVRTRRRPRMASNERILSSTRSPISIRSSTHTSRPHHNPTAGGRQAGIRSDP